MKKKNITLGIFLACVSLSFAQLNGTYTIGGLTPDYSTIGSASDAVKNLGISGPVVFNIREGIYTEQVTFYRTSGADSINTIT